MRFPAPLVAALAAWLSASAGPGVPHVGTGEAGAGLPRGAASTGPGAPAAADTILWPDLTRPRPRPPAWPGQTAPGVGPAPLRLGLKPLDAPFTLGAPTVPGGEDPRLLDPGRSLRDVWTDRLAAHAAPAARAQLAVESWARAGGRPAPPRPPPFLPLPPDPDSAERAPPAVAGQTPGFVNQYANLGMRVQARAELGGDWTRSRPCQDQFQQSCNPGLFPQLSPDLLFGVQVGGTVSDRFHVDVDYDQSREFEATNQIHMYYEGREDEILERLEVGDVNFRLPTSRYLTRGVPAGNFGFQATGALGPLRFQTVWAEQKGDLSSREFRLSGVGAQRGFVQEDTLVLDDADYVRGQFFFLIDPREIVDYPHLDVLSLDPSAAPSWIAPGALPVQLYRYENDPGTRQQVEGHVQADAAAGLGADTVHEAGWFRYLQPGLDYFVHPSGLWVALRNPLRSDEMLAVTYVTAAGDTIGDYNPERIQIAGGRPRLRLLKATAAQHQPGRPTWEQEMHQVYRLSGSGDVEPASVELTISLGERSAGRTFKRGLAGEDITFLRLFGLDEESPLDRLDAAPLYQPGRDVFQDQPPVQGTFIVFPTMRPFREPPPLESMGLTPGQTQQILGGDANLRIYDHPDPFERENGGLFRLTVPYRVRSEGVISSFSLGALGIRDGSERIRLGDRELVEGVDYDIDYDVGQVTFREPEALFATAPDAPVRATWEQKQIFQSAPTSVFGLTAHWGLGDRGAVDVVGLYRTEKTLMTRPQLGVEPGAIGLGGVSGRWQQPIALLDRALDWIPGLRFDGASALRLDGEMALSLPDPNTSGEVFVDDFDATSELPLSLLAHEWTLGSAPAHHEGAFAVLPAALDQTDAAELVWQHNWIIAEGTGGDSVGVHEGFLPKLEIDKQIQAIGATVREPGLLLSFGGPRPRDGQRWRSVTTTLSPTGTDLTRSEYLEFYAAGGDALTMVVDLGVVSEDALFIDGRGLTGGTRWNEEWGLNVLDQEADPHRGEIWGDVLDERGVWDERCVGRRGAIYRIADPSANCTRSNGRRDSEDLDGDGNLDETERHLRFVVELGPSSPYLARTRNETGTSFRLYRIPLADPRVVHVGGTLTEADLRAVKNIRLTLVGAARSSLTLARMRITGSRWIKRGQQGVLRGLSGDTVGSGGRVEVGPVSRVTAGTEYASPPGVLDQLADPTSAFGPQGAEFNEKSLGIRFEDVAAGERAELYNRFPQRPRDFLGYREAKLWVVGRSGDWGEDRPHYFFFKVGTDAENFYLYRKRLPHPANPGGVTTDDWLPQVVVDFDQWLQLRRRAELVLIGLSRVGALPSPGDPPVVLWNADSTYAVVLKDRGRAPDLANVRELALGVINEGSLPISGEIWVDELRLSGAVRDPGLVGHLDLSLSAADVVDTRVSFARRGAFFRQLEEGPTYQSDQYLSVTSTMRLDRLAPASWGIDMPLTVSHDRSDQDPTFLSDSDLRADLLPHLRATGLRQSRVTLGFRKSAPAANPLLGLVLDGLDARLGWFRSSSSAVTSVLNSTGTDARLGYTRVLERRDVPLVPGVAAPLVGALLPGFLERPLLGARLRWSPERFSVASSYLRYDDEIARYEQIILLTSDTSVAATRAARQAMESVAELRLQPLQALSADLTFLSTRDLLPPEASVTDPLLQERIRAERWRVAGMDLGWETNRSLRTRVDFRPRLFRWLQHDVSWTTRYFSDRNTSFARRVATPADTTLELQRNAAGERDLRALVSLDPAAIAARLREVGDEGLLPLGLAALRPVSVTWQDGLSSRFHRDDVSPGAGFQLGLGDTRSFRLIDGDTAATLIDRTTWTVRSGVALGPGLSVDLGWARTRLGTLDTRSDRTVDDETWPDVMVRVARLPLPAPLARRLQTVSVSSGYQHNVRETAFGRGSQQSRVDEDRQIPVELTVGWAGVTTSYRGTFRVGDGSDPTGVTDRGRHLHRLAVTSALVPPFGIGSRLDRPMQLGVILSYGADRDCRAPFGRVECTAFVDQLTRAVSATLDTSVGGFEMGLQASYNARQSFVGRHTGSTQFQLGLFGQFLFTAGAVPVRAVR